MDVRVSNLRRRDGYFGSPTRYNSQQRDSTAARSGYHCHRSESKAASSQVLSTGIYTMSTLSRDQARAFYDRFGARQDKQAFYEDAATDDLIAHADFEHAQSVFEFGCGTGRFAQRLFETRLSAGCAYRAVDISTTMVELAHERLSPWAQRARIERSAGMTKLAVAEGALDRFVSNYVLDLLSEDDIRALIAEAHRSLRPTGLLCLVSVTFGATWGSRRVGWLWRTLYSWRPQLVGGCRPIRLLDYLPTDAWRIRHHGVVTRWWISSEVVVAERLTAATLDARENQ